MADPLYELLSPYFSNPPSSTPPPSPREASPYLSRLSTLPLHALTTSEPASLLQSTQSHLRNLQALSKRSHKAIIASSSHLANLSSLLPDFSKQAEALNQNLPALESAATNFAAKYERHTSNPVLDRRKRAALLNRNVDRISDVLDLPSLLQSTITTAQIGNNSTNTSATAPPTTSYSQALDVHAHIKRLRALYPQSELVGNIAQQSEVEMENLAGILIASLQSPSLKLAAGMRTVGLLRRVAPELAGEDQYAAKGGLMSTTKSFDVKSTASGGGGGGESSDGALGSLFLVCRLKMLHNTLSALDPLRELADQETSKRLLRNKQQQTTATTKGPSSKQQQQPGNSETSMSQSSSSSSSSQTERFLKRYIEIYRELSFGILGMYKSIFPSSSGLPAEPSSQASSSSDSSSHVDALLPLPSPVASFAMHLVDMLEDTLREYLPNVVDPGMRESLLTQVLYCAGSLGRLGGEFGIMIAGLEDELAEEEMEGDEDGQEEMRENEREREWERVMKKHRVQASRLEILARGVGSGARKGSGVLSPGGSSPGGTPLAAG